MTLRFFDVNIAVGRPRNEPLFEPLTTPGDLKALLDEKGLQGALIWYWAQSEGHPESGNALIEPFRKATENLTICWSILPPLTDEQGDVLERMRQANVKAVRLFPQSHRYPMNRVAWGDLLGTLSDCRVPVLLSLENGCGWDHIYSLLDDYPNLTCILCDTGTWSMDRLFYPLLDRFPNVHIETSMVSITDGGVEATASRFGASRLVFGSGFPRRYVEAAALQLAHADLAEDDRQSIAADNIQRLLGEASL